MENTIQSDLIRGHINTIILKALYDGDRYGYDIVREIEQKSSGQYKLKQPTLYSCLKRLEIQGFIRSYWGAKSNGGRRKYFTLTDMGRELFIKNQSEWEYSRTVIDKLISDREVNLSDYISADNYSDNGGEETEEFEDEDNTLYGSTDENDLGIEDEISSASEQEELVIADETARQNVEQHTAATSASYEMSAEQEAASVTFSDTTEIMNELFRQQMAARDDSSYADKLVAEKYVSDKTTAFSSDTYFRDFTEDIGIKSDYDTEPYDEDYTQPAEPYNKNVSPTIADEQEIEEAANEIDTARATEAFYDYHTSTVMPRPENAVIEREYRNILGELLTSAFVSRPLEEPRQQHKTENAVPESPAAKPEPEPAPEDQIEEPTYADKSETYTSDVDVNRKLNTLAGEVREMGNNVVIRTHNNESSKEYANTYYYYSNKLMIVHYGLLFGIMMLEILFTAVFVNLVLHAGRSSDKWVYILAVLVAVAFPVVAFIKNLNDTDKRKRINFSLKNSLIYRVIIMVQCFLIIYCINLMLHMPLSFSIDYITTLLLPALMSLCFPISALIFNWLFKSKRFSVEQ